VVETRNEFEVILGKYVDERIEAALSKDGDDGSVKL
jgi:hypothetical protein